MKNLITTTLRYFKVTKNNKTLQNRKIFVRFFKYPTRFKNFEFHKKVLKYLRLK
jgi:hypothetical protein